jgi:hypothetical protein
MEKHDGQNAQDMETRTEQPEQDSKNRINNIRLSNAHASVLLSIPVSLSRRLSLYYPSVYKSNLSIYGSLVSKVDALSSELRF